MRMLNLPSLRGCPLGVTVIVSIAAAPAVAQQGLIHAFSDDPIPTDVSSVRTYLGVGDVDLVDETRFARTPLGLAALDESSAIGGFDAAVSLDETGCSFTHLHDGTDGTDSAVVCVMEFWAITDQTARIRWGGQRNSTTLVELTEARTGTLLVDEDSNSGDVLVPLLRGLQYEFRFFSSGNPSEPAEAWGEFELVQPCSPADINGDGVLNFDDIDAFVAGFLGGCP